MRSAQKALSRYGHAGYPAFPVPGPVHETVLTRGPTQLYPSTRTVQRHGREMVIRNSSPSISPAVCPARMKPTRPPIHLFPTNCKQLLPARGQIWVRGRVGGGHRSPQAENVFNELARAFPPSGRDTGNEARPRTGRANSNASDARADCAICPFNDVVVASSRSPAVVPRCSAPPNARPLIHKPHTPAQRPKTNEFRFSLSRNHCRFVIRLTSSSRPAQKRSS